MAVNAAQASVKTVADPNASYETLSPLWAKSRAACSGERYVKDYDRLIDVNTFRNLLIPFSPSMSQNQYNFYKAEAEWPGITAQFAKMLVGGLLRKSPQLTLPASVPQEAHDWIMNEFGRDDSSLVSFLDEALTEEVKTSASWIFVDYPRMTNADIDIAEARKYKPYPVLQSAEAIVNWQLTTDQYGKTILSRVIVRALAEKFEENDFHPTYTDTAYVHELAGGYYQIRVFQKSSSESSVTNVVGQNLQNVEANARTRFEFIEKIEPMFNGERLQYIPAYPLDGLISPREPLLLPIIDKEVALYNKMSRRNHLLYGAATYTPVISTDMGDEAFDEIVNSGLGTWIKLRQGDTADILKTPTDALSDMDRAIAATIEEMARLGIRMLSPESAQSGIALEIRNAAQTAQLGTLNTKISETMRQVITFMINWRYNLKLVPGDVQFSLSSDFNPAPLGADWLRLVGEWYEGGHLPRSVWVQLLKLNDLLPPDYDDEEAQLEMNADEIIPKPAKKDNLGYAKDVMQQEG